MQNIYYGDRIEHFDGQGNFLGFTSLLTIPEFRRRLEPSATGDGGFVFGGFRVTPEYFPRGGGFFCLEGNDFTRVLSYGTVDLISIPCTQTTGLKTPEIIELPQIPGPGESYQRVGFGFIAEDFEWVVGPESRGSQNTGQLYPICSVADICDYGDGTDEDIRYYINKRGLFTCRIRCVRAPWVRFHQRFLRWSCGECP